MQISYATKAFNNDLDIAEYVSLLLRLDPLSGISEDDKMARLSNGGITKLDYVVSSNINKFVSEAIEKDAGFAEVDIIKQKAIVYAMATEQIAGENAAIIPPDANEL
jgi:hypothetical protein